MSTTEKLTVPVQNYKEQNHSFLDKNNASLSHLFEIMALPEQAAHDLNNAVELTQPWTKGDHSRPDHKHDIESHRIPEMFEIYDSIGLLQEKPLPAASFDQVLVLGGLHNGNNRRMKFMKSALQKGDVQTDSLLFLGGERKVYPEVELDDINKNMREIATRNAGDVWIKKLKTGESNIWWETDLLRLVMIAKLGDIAVKEPEQHHGLYDRPHVQDFAWNDTPIKLLHTAAVIRNGDSRHTTEACIQDWLETEKPKKGSEVAFVTANPHIERTGKSAKRVLYANGRTDIELAVAGPSAYEGLKHTYFLGEVARNLYEDKRAKVSA